jgi:predicted transcriptional regulator of viral defense system
VNEEKTERLQRLFACEGPVVRSKLLRHHGFDSRSIQSLLAANALVRLKDGYYVMADTLPQLSDAQIAVATIPGAVLYFLSAAAFHQLTNVIPTSVYVAVPNKGVIPTKPTYPPVDITRFIPSIHVLGKTMEATKPVPVACYNPERTICDLAKRWQETGKDVLIEAIRIYLQGDRNLQLLYDYADQLRVRDIIHPYLEAMA